MRLSLVSFNTIVLANLLDLGCFAQFGGLPECAVGFLLNSAINSSMLTISLKEKAGLSALGATGCHIPDFQCICSNQTYINSLEPAFRADCDPSDVTSKLQGTHLCLKVSHVPSRSNAVCLEPLQPSGSHNHYLCHSK
jgi:CFEM domain